MYKQSILKKNKIHKYLQSKQTEWDCWTIKQYIPLSFNIFDQFIWV